MSDHRHAGLLDGGKRWHSCESYSGGNRQSRHVEVGRGVDTDRVSPRDRGSPLPHKLSQSASLDRRSAWANSQSRGQGSGLVRECRVDTSREQPGRISKRVIESFQRGRGFERLDPSRATSPSSWHVGRRRWESQDGGNNIQRYTTGQRNDGALVVEDSGEEEDEEEEEEQEIQEVPEEEQLKQPQQQQQQQQQYGRVGKFPRFEPPLPRRPSDQAASKTSPRNFDEARYRGGGAFVGARSWGQSDGRIGTGHVEVSQATCVEEGRGSRTQERTVDLGLYHRPSLAEGCSGSVGYHHAEGEVVGIGRRGFQLGSGAKFGVGAPRAREDCKHSRSPRRGERIQARRQSSERTWERQREVDRGLERRPQREEGGRQGWQGGQEGTVLEGTRGSSSGANQAELTPCLGAAAHKLQPLVHAARGFPDGVRQDATRLTGSAFEDYPFSSVLLGGELLKLLLGRGCGFGDAVSNFCETSPIETAEGRVKKECNIFPLPLPSNNDLEQMRARGDQKGIWLFIVVCSLNYLNGGIHVQMFSGPPSKVQSRILDYLRERVDVFLGHEFKIIRFDWSRFLQTRSVNYSGEEVRTAKWTSWGHVKPALPYGAIGSVRATEFAEGVVLNLLRNPKPHLLSGWEDMNVKSSRVMVRDEDWGDLARGLVEYGVCCIIPSSAVATCNGRRLHNGVFGVEKNEDVDGVPVHRLIMNLIPLNSISHPVAGSVCTLPLLHQMSALQLHVDEELIVSSEDIRCMFYIFSLPETWFPFLTFGKPVPEDLVPPHCTEECFLAARVLPMGYLNSVGIAQHLHRNIIRNAVGSPQNFPSGSEIRRDRPWSLSNPLWRVYLDNLDQLKKVNHHEVGVLEGKLSTEMSPLVAAYADRGIPLNEKKSVKQAVEAEMQGADLDGSEGFARPRGEKLGKYCSAAVSLVRRRRCSQKEIQVVGGGLVYFCMFRRPLMSSLNSIWRFIQSFEEAGPRVRDIPSSVLSELLMFLGLLPLAHLDLRAPLSGLVTASDASLLGGGVCCSEKVTTLGKKVAESSFRGQGPEVPEKGIVCVGLFDGIGALRVALEALGANVTLHVSVEASEAAKRVVESNFSDVVHVNGVDEVTLEMCQEWSRKCSSCSLVIVGAGLPCPLGSHMNFEEDETAEDPRSGLHRCVLPIVSMLGKAFDWCEVRFIQECIASVDREVKISYTRAADVIPYELCASQLSPCRRCRLYWFDWTLESAEGVKLYPPSCGDASGHGKVDFEIATTFKGCFEKGWDKHPDSKCLSAFTTSQPSASPRSRPAGIHKCDDATRARWMSDRHRFPPYQYKETNLLWNKGKCRIPNVSERERCLGFPVGYTLHAVDKATIKSTPLHAEDVQMTLLGSTWSIPIVAFLLLQLLQPRNLCLVQTLSELLNGLFADEPVLGSSLLTWRGLDPQACSDDQDLSILLNSKLLTLMSAKGADVMIQASHGSRNFQRFRTSVPANLWSWRTVCGFPWAPGEGDHINRLELRAVYTALRWRVLRRNNIRCRLLHLTDSMVCLHVLSRGRSSSRKIQSLMFRVSSLLLAAGLQTYVAYVSSATNPADRPSRHLRVKRKWSK